MKVYDVLLQASKGISPEYTSEELEITKKSPPDDVIFSERVAFIPPVTEFLDTPFWKQYSGAGSNPGGFGQSFFENGQWVNQDDEVFCFGISKHGKDDSLWRITKEVLFGIDNSVSVPVYSSVSGLILRNHTPFGIKFDFLCESQHESRYRDKFMYAITFAR